MTSPERENRQVVLVLLHSHELDECEEIKLIGVYTSRELAEDATRRLRDQPGFRLYPDGFHVGGYPLNTDYWAKGFKTD